VLHQAVEIKPIMTDRDTAAVDNAVDAESDAIFLFEILVVVDEQLEETASYATQSDQGQPDSLHRGLASGNGFMDHGLVVRCLPTR
jgi:hypothetical protein